MKYVYVRFRLLDPIPHQRTSLLSVNHDKQDLTTPVAEACRAWLTKSPSADTRSNYERDLNQFLRFVGRQPNELHCLLRIGLTMYRLGETRYSIRA